MIPLDVNAITRQSRSNFYFSFFSLPKEKRQAITAVYAFCRVVDDTVDAPKATDPSAPGAQDPHVAIAQWRQEIDRTYDGKPTCSLTRSLHAAIENFQLSKEYFDGILTGVEMDLKMNRYATFEALSKYCYHVAGEVGLLCMEIFGYRSERLRTYAVKLGTAFQLTNILRDVKTDAQKGRIYLPQDELARFGVSEEDILQNRLTPVFQKFMAFQARRARGYYHEASVLPLPQERPALRAAEIMRSIYENILLRIERADYDVFSKPIRVPTPMKIALALKTWWEYR